MNRTVAKEQGGVNNKIGGVACGEGITGPYAKDVAKDCDTVWRFSWVQAKGIVGLGSEPDGIGSRVGSGRLRESECPFSSERGARMIQDEFGPLKINLEYRE